MPIKFEITADTADELRSTARDAFGIRDVSSLSDQDLFETLKARLEKQNLVITVTQKPGEQDQDQTTPDAPNEDQQQQPAPAKKKRTARKKKPEPKPEPQTETSGEAGDAAGAKAREEASMLLIPHIEGSETARAKVKDMLQEFGVKRFKDVPDEEGVNLLARTKQLIASMSEDEDEDEDEEDEEDLL